MIVLTTYEEARDGFRHRDLRQALYDEGVHLMDGVIVNLHGDPHVARRRLENRLFRRDTFAWYETDRIPTIIDRVLAAALAAGRGDLLPLARRTMMALSVEVAGVDIVTGGAGDGAEAGVDEGGGDADADFERLYGIMNRLARASTVAHATGDKEAIIADGDEALAEFEAAFYHHSLYRRQRLVRDMEEGRRDPADLPRDVLTTLLVNTDKLDLPPDTILREVAYFPWVGSHSTSAQLVHAMHHIFTWIDEHPADRDVLIADGARRQAFVHESMRLHPASPVAERVATADIELKSGRRIPEGTAVTVSVEAANRDPEAFGPEPDRFDPDRRRGDGVPPWGLSFGTGTHACLGQELAGGLEPEDALHHHLLGAVTLMAGSILANGARPDPDDPPSLDQNTTRHMWGRYPVLFDVEPTG
ncbi:MAG: cytochrome P450 [Acidimicrobiia bacterium]|nr:cytochrome P450 [Acidimicrobiia bacterium]